HMQHIAAQFQLKGSVESIIPFGSGHINTSYRVQTSTSTYLLQKINHFIFTDVAALSNNIQQVTDHIRAKIAAATGPAGEQQTLQLVPTQSGAWWHQDQEGQYWRVFDFLTGLVSFDVVNTPEQAYAGARSYGFFLRFLDDLPATNITPILPNFHNITTRLEAYEQARTQVQGKLKSRELLLRPETGRIARLASSMQALQRAWQTGQLPTRITHNDTKFNNVLLTPAGEGRAVIDLDTVMPGIVHFDYGDGIRTAAATAAEDEADLQLVGIDLERYRAFTDGYLSVTQAYLSPTERQTLPQAGALLAYLMAVRFLTDFLMGDVYYTTKYPEHNLVRGRNQLKLAEALLEISRNG
ncbi:MAG: aminoglycoside phosphotransferase family protein, partial [Bacteroidota bacterium]